MISAFAGLMLQAIAPMPAQAAPPPPPPPRPGRMEPARARANLASLISNNDYPAEALRHNEQGTVGFRLQIGPDGVVTACTITSSSGFATLDSTTCRLMIARARFSPARDRRGRPVADSVAARIIWRIEKSDPIPVVPTLLVDFMRAAPTGELTCSFFADGQSPETYPCPKDMAARMGARARAAGRPLEQTLTWTMTPEREAEPVDRADRGMLVFESEAILTIAADGAIAECRVTRRQSHGPTSGDQPPASLCEDFAPGPDPVFQPAATPGARRALTIRFRSFIRF